MKMPDRDSPIWSIAYVAIVMASLTAILYANASHFDETELQALFTFFGALLGAEVLRRQLPHK